MIVKLLICFFIFNYYNDFMAEIYNLYPVLTAGLSGIFRWKTQYFQSNGIMSSKPSVVF